MQNPIMKLGDDQWRQLEPFLRGMGMGVARARNNRKFIDAILWFISNKYNAWVDMPPEFGARSNIYMRFRRWNESNFWRQLVDNVDGDDTLMAMLERIAEYADHERKRVILKREKRAIYAGAKATFYRRVEHNISQDTLLSTSHWVGLVSK